MAAAGAIIWKPTPNVRLWSEANPGLVPAEKARLGALD
jgi:hypothetical protein